MEISFLIPVLSSIVPFIVEWVKQTPTIKAITPETKGRLLALAALLSSGAGVASGLADGTIDGNSVQMLVDAGWQASVAFGFTQAVYNFLKWTGVFSKSEE